MDASHLVLLFIAVGLIALSRRLFATVCFGSENFDRRCAALLRREACASPKRSTGNVRSVAANGDQRRGRPRISFRTDRDRRWNISDTALAILPMGAHSTGGRSIGVVHSDEFDRWISWLLYKSPFYSFAGSYPCSSCDHWRHHRLAFGQQTLCCSGDFAFFSIRSLYCRNEVDFHKMKMA